jgi:hypothetical protein
MKISESEKVWNDHCKRMMDLCDAKATELKAQGWKKIGRGRGERFTRNGETVVLRRQLGSSIWYTVSE